MKECSWQALTFACEHPEDFNRIVCQKSEGPSKLLFAYRVFAELYTVAICIWFVCELFLTNDEKLYISYLAYVQIFWTASSEFAFMTSLRTAIKFDAEDPQGRLSWYTKSYWSVFSATLPAVVLSFIVFWAEMSHENVNVLYIFMGNVTPLLSLIEFGLVAFPLRILHFYYFLTLIIVFILITVAYQFGLGVDSHSVYKDLDWKYPKHAILTSFIAVLVGEAAYVIFWGLSKLKLTKCFPRETA